MRNDKTENFRCGMVAIIGRPNVGKSTLLNKIIGEKVSIVSKIPQTTRNQVRGIYHNDRGQIIFIDTPGLHIGKDKLTDCMNRSAYGTTYGADCVIHLVDTMDQVGKEEELIVEKIKYLKVPIILGLNKVDLKGRYIPEYIQLWERIKGKPVTEMESFTLLPISGKTGINIVKLVDILFENLPPGEALYPKDTVSDTPQKMVIADIIREKLLGILRHEVPYSLAVMVESIAPKRKKTLHICAVILVQRDSQKAIVIGKEGENLKNAGTLARLELEDLLDSKVFLELYVKDNKNWRNDSALLEEMGYQAF